MAINIKGKNVTKTINEIIKTVKGLDKEVAEIAKKGLETAKSTLSYVAPIPNFTQKHRRLLVEEIGLIQTAPNEYKIVAPLSGNTEIAYEMYYAEYGAGIGAMNNLDKSSRPISAYTPHYQTMDEEGYWKYYELDGTVSKVNTSEPANYMYMARKRIRKEMNNTTVKMRTKIRTVIKRNYQDNG